MHGPAVVLGMGCGSLSAATSNEIQGDERGSFVSAKHSLTLCVSNEPRERMKPNWYHQRCSLAICRGRREGG